MKIGVLGAGLMGKEVVRDLILNKEITEIGLADLDFERVKEVCEHLNTNKLTAYQVNATDKEALENYIKRFDVIVNALFYAFNEIVAKTAIRVGTHVVDLGGHIGHITDKVLQLKEEAKQANITIIPDLGVAPGMINILAGFGVKKLTKAKEIKLYVGGIPLRPEAPIEYKHVFSMESVLDHYTDPSLIIRKGVRQEVPSLSEIEPIYFDKFGPLEAFHTSGGTSTLPITYPYLETLEYKTIRYPNHAKKFQLLVDLNLTKNDYEVEIDGQKINPKKVLLKVLDPIVELGKAQDVVLLRVIVNGKKDTKELTCTYEMIVHKDEKLQVTAMARVTANTISVVAQMIASGLITKRGVYPPEQIVPGDLYIDEMKKRDIIIKEHLSS